MSNLVDVVVGVLGRAHGIKGEVSIEPRTDEPERRFSVGARVFVDGRSDVLTVASMRWANSKLLVRFAELPDRTAVEAARGWLLIARVPADETPDDEGEYYDRQLIGLRAVMGGDDVGVVTDVIHLPAQDLLAIETSNGERLVPFVEALVPAVDLAEGTVTLAEIDGLLEDLDD